MRKDDHKLDDLFSIKGQLDSVRLYGEGEYNWAEYTGEQFIAKLLAWRDTAVAEARIDELKRLYLVFGSQDAPASLDNLFRLGDKGEVVATPIKKRLAELQALTTKDTDGGLVTPEEAQNV